MRFGLESLIASDFGEVLFMVRTTNDGIYEPFVGYSSWNSPKPS